TPPAHVIPFHLIRPGSALPKGIVQASPPMVESVRVARRVAPDGQVVFDLVAEVTQSCTVNVAGNMFDMDGGCTVVIDPQGEVRYSIRSEEHTSELQSRFDLVCRLLLEK